MKKLIKYLKESNNISLLNNNEFINEFFNIYPYIKKSKWVDSYIKDYIKIFTYGEYTPHESIALSVQGDGYDNKYYHIESEIEKKYGYYTEEYAVDGYSGADILNYDKEGEYLLDNIITLSDDYVILKHKKDYDLLYNDSIDFEIDYNNLGGI